MKDVCETFRILEPFEVPGWKIGVRIAWNAHDGMYAEAASYAINLQPWVPVSRAGADVRELCQIVVAEYYTSGELTAIMNDDEAFSKAINILSADRRADISYIRSQQI